MLQIKDIVSVTTKHEYDFKSMFKYLVNPSWEDIRKAQKDSKHITIIIVSGSVFSCPDFSKVRSPNVIPVYTKNNSLKHHKKLFNSYVDMIIRNWYPIEGGVKW